MQVKTFCEKTTAHGVGHVVDADAVPCVRITWCVVIVLALAGNFYHLATVISQYVAYGTQETLFVSSAAPTFPHVTVCNLRGASTSSTGEQILPEFEDHINRVFDVNQSVYGDLQNEYGVSSHTKHNDGFRWFKTALNHVSSSKRWPNMV